MRRLAPPLLLLTLALACTALALLPAHQPGAIALPIPMSRTAELDINLWDNWLVTVWWQDLQTRTNHRIAAFTLPIWPAIGIILVAGVWTWRRRNGERRLK